MSVEELRETLLGTPDRAVVIKNAVEQYNRWLAEVRQGVVSYREKHPALSQIDVLKKGRVGLQFKLARYESELRYRRDTKLSSKREHDSALLSVIEHVISEAGEDGDCSARLETILMGIKKPTRISDYGKYVSFLRTKGIVVEVTHPASAASQIRRLHNYQIAVLPRSAEVPPPLSQNLIKEPEQSTDELRAQLMRYYVEQKLKETYKLTLDQTRRTTNLRIRRFLAACWNDNELKATVDNILSDIIQLHPLRLTSDVTLRRVLGEGGLTKVGRNTGLHRREIYNRFSITPRVCYHYAFENMEEGKYYFTSQFYGLDRVQLRVLLFTNIWSALRMMLYSQAHEKLVGETTNDVSKEYAGGAEGTILSRSGIRDWYDADISRIVTFARGMKNPGFDSWPNAEAHCHCKDAQYVGRLHHRREHTFVYWDIHATTLALMYYQRALNNGETIHNIFALPREEQIKFLRKLERQVLVTKKIDGALKVPNRAETEWLSLANAREIGYERAYTTALPYARTAAIAELGLGAVLK